MWRSLGWAFIAASLFTLIFLGGPWHYRSIDGDDLGLMSAKLSWWFAIPLALLLGGLASLVIGIEKRRGWIPGILLIAASALVAGFLGDPAHFFSMDPHSIASLSTKPNRWFLISLAFLLTGLRILALKRPAAKSIQ